MATLNDFKLLNKVCLNYFDLAKDTQDFDKATHIEFAKDR